jgi:glycerophosphoryl diester phosphodiesterase
LPLVIAHRGASAIGPENSLAAFRHGIEQGADGIELDVHGTADGVIMVHHDPEIGGMLISQSAHRALRNARLSNGEPLPTLEHALQVIGDRVTVFIEAKTLSPEHDGALLSVIDGAPAPGRCHVHSFDHRIVRRLHEQRPDLTFGVLSTSYPVDPVAQMVHAGASELWQHDPMVDAPLVGTIHESERRIYAWTVDDPERMRMLAAWGVDGICTNHTDVARAALT